MSDLLIRHVLGQGPVVLCEADGGPFFGGEVGEQVVEKITMGGKRRKSALLLTLLSVFARRGKDANSSINS